MLNPYSWNEVSNLLFLSQPIGVGFSYESTEVGYWDEDSRNVTLQPIEGQNEGRHSVVDPETTDTTYLAAIGAWEVLQAFYWNLPKLDMEVKNRTFNLWTESYGGHYGPTFYRYFSEQNDAILNGTCSGVQLQMDTLGIINGACEAVLQSPLADLLLQVWSTSSFKHHTIPSSRGTTPMASRPSTRPSTSS